MSSPRKRALILLAVIILPGALRAQVSRIEFGDTVVHITADKMEYERETQRVHFSGQVTVRNGPYRIYAEQMDLDLNASLLDAHGEVRITAVKADREREILSAQDAHIELPENRGWLAQGRMVVPWERGEATIWGDRLEWLDEHTFRFESGGFTTCRCKPTQKPDWAIQAKKLEADTEKAVKLQSARVQIRGLTVFYIPVFSYPLGTERRSGFLLPEVIFSSRNGAQVILPYYQVLGPSADATLYPHYLEERGFKPGAEFRYNLGDPAEGQAEAYGIQDFEEDADRWAVKMRHRSVFPHGFELKSDVNLISDNEYVVDFDDFSGLRYARSLESRLVGAWHRPGSNLTAEFSWFDDLMGGDLRWSRYGGDLDEIMIQRLPEARYTLLSMKLVGPLYADLSARADYYWRDFRDAGRGVRADAMPRVIYADKWASVMEVWAAAGWREIYYHPDPDYFDEDSRAGRPELSSRISVPLERVFAGREQSPNRYRHTVEPGIVYFYSGETEEPADPFFMSIESAEEINLVGLNLESRLFRKTTAADAISIREINRVEVTQFYDFVSEELPDLRVEVSFDPAYPGGLERSWGEINLKLNGYYGWDEEKITRIFAETRYTDPRRDTFSVGYLEDVGWHHTHLYLFDTLPVRDVFAGTGIIITRGMKFSYSMQYSLEYEILTEQKAALDFIAPQRCWAVTVAVSERIRPDRPDRPHDVKTAFLFRLEGI